MKPSAVLMQADSCGKDRAVAYASRSLNSADGNYSITHRETLAVVWALKHFKDIILGNNTTIYMDHTTVRAFQGEKPYQ